ncbi:hypothetical protein EC988_007136, partial [Linderina pennispora]
SIGLMPSPAMKRAASIRLTSNFSPLTVPSTPGSTTQQRHPRLPVSLESGPSIGPDSPSPMTSRPGSVASSAGFSADSESSAPLTQPSRSASSLSRFNEDSNLGDLYDDYDPGFGAVDDHPSHTVVSIGEPDQLLLNSNYSQPGSPSTGPHYPLHGRASFGSSGWGRITSSPDGENHDDKENRIAVNESGRSSRGYYDEFEFLDHADAASVISQEEQDIGDNLLQDEEFEDAAVVMDRLDLNRSPDLIPDIASRIHSGLTSQRLFASSSSSENEVSDSSSCSDKDDDDSDAGNGDDDDDDNESTQQDTVVFAGKLHAAIEQARSALPQRRWSSGFILKSKDGMASTVRAPRLSLLNGVTGLHASSDSALGLPPPLPQPLQQRAVMNEKSGSQMVESLRRMGKLQDTPSRLFAEPVSKERVSERANQFFKDP